jgi:hypothetical protein
LLAEVTKAPGRPCIGIALRECHCLKEASVVSGYTPGRLFRRRSGLRTHLICVAGAICSS